MKLYDVKASPSCRKVRVVARELGLSLELVSLDSGEPRRAEVLAHDPAGGAPTLVDEDLRLWESAAILIYLAEKKPELRLLPPEAATRADVLRWVFFAASHVQPWISLLGQERILKAKALQPPEVTLVNLAERELRRALPILEEQLAERYYLVGAYSIGDIAVGCALDTAESRGFSLAAFPQVLAWRERLRQRAAWND